MSLSHLHLLLTCTSTKPSVDELEAPLTRSLGPVLISHWLCVRLAPNFLHCPLSRILSWPWIPSPAPPRARLKLVTAAADAAIHKPAAADWLDPAHNSDDGTCGEERNRYPRSTKETASSLSLATVYSVRFPFY